MKRLYLPLQRPLGNTRVSFARNSAGASEILDTGNYYALDLNHIGEINFNISGFCRVIDTMGKKLRKRNEVFIH